MFQTEFCGSDYKFVISWDSDSTHLYDADQSIDNDQNLFYKLNELYDNISKFTTEFVDCVKRVPNTTDDEQVHEINPNMPFKIENLKNTEAYSDEVFLLRKEVEKLKNQKEQIENDYKNCMLRHTEEISKLREDEEAKLRKMENKYKLEMSDLRIYFENSYTDYLKQLTEVISNQYSRSKVSDVSSTSENETGRENYEITDSRCCDPEFDQHFTIRDHACKLEVSDESKIKIKENINKDLKNIIRTYNMEINKYKKDLELRKNEEVEDLKRCMDVKYGSIIDTLQSEVNQLLYNKALEDKVKELHSMLKREGMAEFHNLQNNVDNLFLENAENERDALEQELKSRFQDQLIELSNEWRNKFESLLSDIIVDSAVKNVTYEINRKSLPQSPKKPEVEPVKSKTIEKEYKDKLDQMKTEYEDRIQMMVSNFEENAEKLNVEKEQCLEELKELQKLNDHLRTEIETLKTNFVTELKTLQSSQDFDVEKMETQLNTLRKIHEAEVSCLKDENAHLRKKINELLELDFNEHETRSTLISHLCQEIEDLIRREENGDCVTWPSDLAIFEELFARKFCPEKSLTASSPDNMESPKQSTEMNDEANLDEILQERDALRKINVAVHNFGKVLTDYLTNCEEELNNTIVNQLVNGDRLRENFSTSFEGDSICDISDMNAEEGVKKVHFAPDVTELLASFCSDHDFTSNRSVSVFESKLNACLERLKNEAAAVLCLTAGKKMDADDVRLTVAAQTDLSDDQLRERIKALEKGLSFAEEEISRLTKKMNNQECLEAYGERSNAPLLSGCFQSSAGLEGNDELNVLHYPDEFCSKCEKQAEEAKKEIEDLQAQVQAAHNQLKSLKQFLEGQTAEREHERLEFDRQIEQLEELLKEKERDYMSKYGSEISNLQQQNKKLAIELEQCQNKRENLETKVTSLQNKIVKLKESTDDSETKSAQQSESIRRLEAKLKKKEDESHQLRKENQILLQQLECIPESNPKQFEELSERHIIFEAMFDQVKNEIYEVERLVISRTRELENKYLPVVASSTISSPSEDVSVCDRIADRAKITSPSDSDLSSPIHVPINELACLLDKLTRLFRAEEAALKKIQDQDMQLVKLGDSFRDLELENRTLSENLSKTSAKLSEAKTELNNWQHGHSSTQSEIQLELSRTIESLENEIQYLKRCIDQKDENIRELTNGLRNLESAKEVDLLKAKLEELQSRCEKQAEQLSESEKNDRMVNKRLSTMLSEREAEIQRLQQKVTLLSSAGCSRFSSPDAGTPSKRTRVSFENNSELFDDSDVSRHAAVAEISTVPRYLVSEIPVTKADLNESLPTHSIRFNETLDAEPITSVRQESDSALSKSDSKDFVSQRDLVGGSRMKTTKRKLTSIQEDVTDGRDCTITLPEIPEVSTSLEDHQSIREIEAEFQKKVSDLETKLEQVNQELDERKEQCIQLESQISGLTDNVESKSQRIQELSREQQKLEAYLEEKQDEISELKKRQRKFENLNKEMAKERGEAQKRSEERFHLLQQLEQHLAVEQGKSVNLNEELEKGRIEQATLRQKVTNLEKELETLRQELQETQDKAKFLTEISSKLEELKYCETDSTDRLTDSSIMEHRSGSLRNLTEKVQKEVERAEEMDKNILKSLESDSRGASFIDELLKTSSSLSDNLKRILFKMLQDGPEGLSIDEKDVLMQSCGQSKLDLMYQVKSRDDTERRLRLQLDMEQKANRELMNDNRKMTAELNRSELLLGYYDERMTFLVSKLDEYRNKAVKVEIELTSERTSRKQLEISFESYKREMYERQIQSNRKLDETAERLNAVLNENAKLKQEIESLTTALEVLTAELNSAKIITHFHSDPELDVSHSFSPLKAKLGDVQEKYTQVKQELETKKEELREVRASWNVDRANHQKLEHLYSLAVEEKNELQNKLVDIRLKFEDLLWQKQKVDEKLEAAELLEVKRRMARISKDGNLRKEQELMKSEQAKLESECNCLRENLLKIRDEHTSLYNDWKRVCEEMKTIFYRMLTAEKNQRCLAFQKIYFIQMLQRCKLEFVTFTRSKLDASRQTHDYLYFSISNSDLTPKQRFKSIGLCLIMMRRIRFLVKRRSISNHAKMVNYFITHLPNTSIYPWCESLSGDDSKKELEKKTYKMIRKSRDFPAESLREPEMVDPLKSIFEQFTHLRDTFVCAGASKSTAGKI